MLVRRCTLVAATPRVGNLGQRYPRQHLVEPTVVEESNQRHAVLVIVIVRHGSMVPGMPTAALRTVRSSHGRSADQR
jgi:hypothetical protein